VTVRINFQFSTSNFSKQQQDDWDYVAQIVAQERQRCGDEIMKESQYVMHVGCTSSYMASIAHLQCEKMAFRQENGSQKRLEAVQMF
jgi:hypothetical protein